MVPLPKVAPGTQFPPLRVGPSDRVFVLTGAGISAESGVRTFRDAGGLWEEHRIEDVATPEGFERDPRLVWRFYSERRQKLGSVHPNPAHLALARLEQRIGDRFFLCTQNVDPLHERAGSRRVHHMHGELLKTRCEDCDRPAFQDEGVYLVEVLAVTAVPADCGRTWSGSGDPVRHGPHLRGAGGLRSVRHRGSSGAVHPAAGLVSHLRHNPNPRGNFARCVYLGLERPENTHSFDECRLGKAGELLPSLFEIAG